MFLFPLSLGHRNFSIYIKYAVFYILHSHRMASALCWLPSPLFLPWGMDQISSIHHIAPVWWPYKTECWSVTHKRLGSTPVSPARLPASISCLILPPQQYKTCPFLSFYREPLSLHLRTSILVMFCRCLIFIFTLSRHDYGAFCMMKLEVLVHAHSSYTIFRRV